MVRIPACGIEESRQGSPGRPGAIEAFLCTVGDVANTTFDKWWKDKGRLFADKYVVRQLLPGEKPNDPESLVIEVPLTQSPTTLTKRVGAIIQDAWSARGRQSRKSKRRPTSDYKLSAGAEPELRAVREMLTVYRDAFLKNKNLRGSDLLEKVHGLYLGRKNKRWAKVPTPLLYDRKYGAIPSRCEICVATSKRRKR